MPLALRPVQPADLPIVARLMNSAYRGTGPNASWNTEASFMAGDRTSDAALAEEIAAKPDAFLLVAEDSTSSANPRIQGCVWLEPVTPATWYLGSLTVDPLLQRSGLGRALLQAAEHFAARSGAQTLQMKVIHVRDTLLAWYQRRGYHITPETHPFPYGDTRFGTPLRDDLTFVILEKHLSAVGR